jgi:hypothetical protein
LLTVIGSEVANHNLLWSFSEKDIRSQKELSSKKMTPPNPLHGLQGLQTKGDATLRTALFPRLRRHRSHNSGEKTEVRPAQQKTVTLVGTTAPDTVIPAQEVLLC